MERVADDFVEYRGCRIRYRLAGRGGPPILLIQGVGVHGDGWDPQVIGLADRFRCLAFDNRGMGRSQPVGGEVSVPSMADDARALMDRAGWESAHVVGHSLGGVIAQELALSTPGRVRSLSLLCTVARGADTMRLSGPAFWLGIRGSIGSRRMRRRAFLRIVMPPSVLATADHEKLAAELAPIFGHDLAEQPPIAMKQLAALRAWDARNRLNELAAIPTLVVSAEYDPIAPPVYGRGLAAAIPGARYVEFADAAHGVTIQRANEVNRLLAEHILAAEGDAARGT
jgi:pimeloyl-ACP methyl ester carboxylesterase